MQFDGDWFALRGEAFALIMKRHLVSGDFETLRGYQEEMLAFTTIWSRLCTTHCARLFIAWMKKKCRKRGKVSVGRLLNGSQKKRIYRRRL